MSDAAQRKVLLAGLTAKLRAALDDPSTLMKQLGALMVAQSQKAFADSRMGEHEWDRRYPNMGEGDNFVNIAGIVSDFAQGKEPPGRRFQARPPLLDTGFLRRTLKDRSTSLHLMNTHQVEVGTTVPYAAAHQWGGQTEQFITDTVRENLKKFLNGGPSWKRTRTRTRDVEVDLSEFAELLPGRQSSAIRKFKKKFKETYQPKVFTVKNDRATGYIGTLTRRERFGARLGFLFRSRVLVTRVKQRPFIGIPDDLRQKMLRVTAEHFVRSVM